MTESTHPFILSYSGRYIDLLDPDPESFSIKDIAHALSLLCRFNGHCREFYSVAQHSVSVSNILRPNLAFAGLLHDAAEAFLGDITRPLKSILPQYRELESRWNLCIEKKFKVRFTYIWDIQHADLRMLATERRDLLYPDNLDAWPCLEDIETMNFTIKPQPPREAEELFIKTFNRLSSLQEA